MLIPGASAPKLVSAALVKQMKKGSVIVDVAIDQGGCFETSRPTTHADPTYVVDGVIHYCVANMPGGVPRTSTFALNNATLPFVAGAGGQRLARALADDPHLRNGLNVAFGKVTCQPVAEALGYAYTGTVRPTLAYDARNNVEETAMNSMTDAGALPARSAVRGRQKMTPSEAFVETLVAHGVTDVFGIVGSAYMDALDLFPLAGIRFISVAHEQGAGHMADGYSRVSGRHGVCIAQNGPGITNFVTAVAGRVLGAFAGRRASRRKPAR